MFYWIVIVLLLPCIAYDWMTSVVGAMAFFGSQGGTTLLTLGIPLAVSIGAIGMNFMTTEILGERGAPEWIKGFWFICIVFDAYTTMLGLAHVKMGGGILSIPSSNLFDLLQRAGPEATIVLAVSSGVFVASPMASFWMWKKAKSQ